LAGVASREDDELAVATSESPINAALRRFEAAEANLEKLERILGQIEGLIPGGIRFGGDPQYDDRCRAFEDVLQALPMIDGWKPQVQLVDLDELAQSRLDAQDVGEIAMIADIESSLGQPGRELAEYRHRLSKERRELIRNALGEGIRSIDRLLRSLQADFSLDPDETGQVEGPAWENLKIRAQEVEMLLGSSLPRPPRWVDLRRHLDFGELCDFRDIVQRDWPAVRTALGTVMYGEDDPIPVGVEDIGTLARSRPTGPIATELNWGRLDAESFERLVFSLISAAKGYENPEWLMHTNAPDRGRDLSVTRVAGDELGGVRRSRVIIQCRHWRDRSVSASDVAALREQMAGWEPPRVDVLVIATTGRFSADAVALIEKQNESDRALRMEMWPDSHLERLLAARPALIAEFGLRDGPDRLGGAP
jgi:hypothetical protein